LPTSPSPASIPAPAIQKRLLTAALAVAAVLVFNLPGGGARQALLFLVGLGIGVSLYHASFGFTSAYRRAYLEKDLSGVSAQMVMLVLAMLLFTPVLATGQAFGQGVVGAMAPVSLSMAFGAFLFGIGMQIAGGCASGTLYTAGGGNLKMILVLIFFSLGTFWGSLDLPWWSSLPGIGVVSLSRQLGWPGAIALQLAVLAAIYATLRRLGGRNKRPLWTEKGFSPRMALRGLRGPWPLLLGAVLLALFNLATLMLAGHPWTITWGFSLWTAKVLAGLGWDPSTSLFWSGGFQQAAMARPILADTTAMMDIAIILGATIAAALAGKAGAKVSLPPRTLAAVAIGGLAMGYGARLAYGCNIGAFFSGVASTSLHGWVWILMAVPGNIIGIHLRPLFRFDR
jgi:uncharacterized membrane protein YedE/YeeE